MISACIEVEDACRETTALARRLKPRFLVLDEDAAYDFGFRVGELMALAGLTVDEGFQHLERIFDMVMSEHLVCGESKSYPRATRKAVKAKRG